MDGVIDLTKIKNEELLEEKTINDRTLICWYNRTTKKASMLLFHLTDQPNELSKKSPYSHWGYITHISMNTMTVQEAGEVISLYLQDMEKDHAWWEKQ